MYMENEICRTQEDRLDHIQKFNYARSQEMSYWRKRRRMRLKKYLYWVTLKLKTCESTISIIYCLKQRQPRQNVPSRGPNWQLKHSEHCVTQKIKRSKGVVDLPAERWTDFFSHFLTDLLPETSTHFHVTKETHTQSVKIHFHGPIQHLKK